MNKLLINHKKTNQITEHINSSKKINMQLLEAYCGIKPSKLALLSNIIFQNILINQEYNTPEENNRLFNNVILTPEIILKFYDPKKFKNNKIEIADINKIKKNINKLHELNIFYIWKLKNYDIYIFIMERDISVWKYYNKGCVTPKTLIKILKLAKPLLKTMHNMTNENKKEITISFKLFINNIINKMHPEVAKQILKIQKKKKMFDYFKDIIIIAEKMNEYEGLVYNNKFINNLPPNIEKIIIEQEKNMELATLNELESMLGDGNLSIKTKKRKKKQRNILPQKANIEFFISINPFENSHSFLKYYKAIIKSVNPSAVFFPINTIDEFTNASEIIDLMEENNKTDKVFLKNWIRNFALSLSYKQIKNPNYTSLVKFKSTFEKYLQNYVG